MHTLVRAWSHKSNQNQHLQTLPPVYINVREWNLHYHQVRQIRTIQQCHLRNILKIKWDRYISNEEVLSRAGLEDIEIKPVRNRLRWLGHLSWKEDESHAVNALLLNDGKCPIGRPKIPYKDIYSRTRSEAWWCHERLAIKSGQPKGMEKTHLVNM